jgi:hypothetical protein
MIGWTVNMITTNHLVMADVVSSLNLPARRKLPIGITVKFLDIAL